MEQTDRRRRLDGLSAEPATQALEVRAPPGIAPVLIELQRTAGNQAVQRLIRGGFGTAPARAIQRAKINPKQVGHILKGTPRNPGESEADYIERLLGTTSAWQAERDVEHNRGVLRAGLPKTKDEEDDAPPPPKRTLTPDQMTHLFVGTYRDKILSGLHSTARKEATIAEGYGQKTALGGGFYSQRIRLRTSPDVTKDKASTFYPDDWSETEIVEAIQYASESRGRKLTLYEVTRPLKGRGVMIFKNPEGYFPYFE
jgi:hypothetical protein